MHIKLVRHAYLPSCTLGKLYIGNIRLYTIERPWVANKRNVSCIPELTYPVDNYTSSRFIDVFEVKDVPNRSHILIHSANYADEVEGCIAPGVGFQFYQNQPMVTQSRLAMNQIKAALAGQDNITLTVTHFEPRYERH